MSDEMDLLVEQVKMLAGDIAFSTSTLKRLTEQSVNDPESFKTQVFCEVFAQIARCGAELIKYFQYFNFSVKTRNTSLRRMCQNLRHIEIMCVPRTLRFLWQREFSLGSYQTSSAECEVGVESPKALLPLLPS